MVYYIPAQINATVTWTLLSIAVLTTIGRLYCRKFLVRVVGLDDYLILLATCFAIGNAPLHYIKIETYASLWDMLGPTAKIDPSIFFSEKFIRQAPISFAAVYLYLGELASTKLAIVAFYYRITPNKAHHYVLYVVSACIVAYTIANSLALFFQFDPVAASWDRTIKGAVTRYKPEDLTVASGSFQVSTDALLLLLPIPILRSLHCSRRTKVGLFLLFSLGTFAMVASAMRLYQAILVQRATGIDGLLAYPPFQLWTDLETNTAIVCANVPALSSLFQRLRKQRKLKASPFTPPLNSGGASKEVKPANSSNSNTTIRANDEDNAMLEKSSGITRTTEFSMDIEANGDDHRSIEFVASLRATRAIGSECVE
ncbi:MAG: hypothetical protein M1829_003855 [Trizodia sp. TS-e1964]|nr:MAG: hypothetical protein M1829_003855 [Trizodia sp. TS-e1964]